jgi:hypothetical protein
MDELSVRGLPFSEFSGSFSFHSFICLYSLHLSVIVFHLDISMPAISYNVPSIKEVFAKQKKLGECHNARTFYAMLGDDEPF